ncbi:hypothetical protein QL996_04810 [Planococcus sp. APC 4015]|nr:hypothetical protein [Planococcus sp. APC 4015]
MSTSPTESAVATLVAQDAVDKLTALRTIARVAASTVQSPATARPTVPLADGVWAQIDIPKFGEPPPLVIDVHAVAGRDVALRHALALLDQLRATTEWDLATDFDRVY